MKEVYLSDDTYPYLDKNALECLHKARMFFKQNNLDKGECYYGDENVILTWAGTIVNKTIGLISKLYLDKTIGFNHIFLNKLTKKDVTEILKHPKPQAESLCPFLMRYGKELNKFDHLLSDKLLDVEYASMSLDVDGAWDCLMKIR
jgi:hypothetical protein